ncbi:MAG TPA: heavy metal translocating P-type ATPase [Nitrososphaeraceae archaeon]|nr:heavy metal translocating P-type ATPase [Nitrososphaeraceae archaeon]
MQQDEQKEVCVENPMSLQFYISTIRKLILFSKRYPIPAIAIIGLIVGTVVHYILNDEETGHWIWFITLVIGGAPIVVETIKVMLHGRFASDIVAMLAISTAIITNEAFPGVIIVIMQSGGRALEDYAFRKATTSLDELMTRSPKIAHRKINDKEIEDVDVERIRIGDQLVIRPGDLVPVDGTIASGNAQIDESSLTGEPLSKIKQIGEEVFSGTINTGNIFEIKAKRISEESQYSKIVKLVKKAREEEAPIQRLADKYAVWFTPITLAMCGFGWLLTQNVQTILSVLVVATPCPLIFATPVAIIGGIDKAAKQSIIVKSGAAIEQISRANAIVFDKTGTITYGIPLVEEIILLDNFKKNLNGRNIKHTKDDILFKAASLEQMSSHPSALSITRAGKEKFNSFPLPTSFHESSGLGVEGYVTGEHIMVGSYNYIESQFSTNTNYDTINSNEDLLKTITDFQKRGKMVALVNINGTNAGIITFTDKIRDGVATMIQNLKKEGMKEAIMLTGDSLDNAKSIANQTGVDNYKYDLLPDDKVNEVKKLREKFKDIVMIGDGINDAPALATASVGIAMGAKGTAISAEAADVVLLVDDVTKVSDVIHISKGTIKIAKQSIFFGMGLSFLLMIFASFGLILPSVGALFQEALDIGVILNALRAK